MVQHRQLCSPLRTYSGTWQVLLFLFLLLFWSSFIMVLVHPESDFLGCTPCACPKRFDWAYMAFWYRSKSYYTWWLLYLRFATRLPSVRINITLHNVEPSTYRRKMSNKRYQGRRCKSRIFGVQKARISWMFMLTCLSTTETCLWISWAKCMAHDCKLMIRVNSNHLQSPHLLAKPGRWPTFTALWGWKLPETWRQLRCQEDISPRTTAQLNVKSCLCHQ